MGTGMALVKSDVSGNIERLRTRFATDTEAFKHVSDIVLREVAAGQHTGGSSCTKGLLWLKRYGAHSVASIFSFTAHPQRNGIPVGHSGSLAGGAHNAYSRIGCI